MSFRFRSIICFLACFCGFVTLWASEFRFVQITDTELDKKRKKYPVLEKAIKSINKLPFEIEFVAHTGDITDLCKPLSNPQNAQDAKAQFKSLTKAKIYYLPGNHDITPSDKDKSAKNFLNYFGSFFQKVVVKGVAMYFVWADMNYDDVAIPGFDPLKKLTQEIDKNPEQQSIIFTHIPPDKNYYSRIWHRGWKTGVKEKWSKALAKYNVLAMICGHVHRPEVQSLGKIPVYVSPAISEDWNRVSSYRVWHCKDGVLTCKTICPGDEK